VHELLKEGRYPLARQKCRVKILTHNNAPLVLHLFPFPLCLLILLVHYLIREDLPKAAAVTEQTKALISRKPLPLPVVLERREKKRREGKK